MSFNIERLECVNILDPRVDVNKKREYAILKGGQQVSWKPYTTNSVSNSSLQFSCPPPSPNIIIDRKIYFNTKVEITIPFVSATYNNHNATPVPNAVFIYDCVSLRSFPLSKMINTLQITINNTSASINLGEIIDALMRYNDKFDLRNYEYSLTPTMQDNTQNYSDISSTVRDPLALYGDNSYEITRGAFPVESFVITPTNAQGIGSIVMTIDLTEPFFLSPLFYGCGNESGFIGVQTMDFNITLNSEAQRFLSVNEDKYPNNVVISNTITEKQENNVGVNELAPNYSSISFKFIEPKILFTYITPKLLEDVPRDAIYPYFEVSRYPTNNPGVNLAPLAKTTLSSNNIQLQSIPRRMYIFARQQYSTLLASPNLTDSYLAIDKISINWNNQSGLFSSATQKDLYNVSKKNGCNISWTEWSGKRMLQQGAWTTAGALAAANSISGIGSVLCIEFGTDLALQEMEAPGLLGTFQLQMNVDVINCNTTVTYPNIDLYIVVVSEGVFNILDNRSVSQIGVITKQDVLEAQRSAPYLDYNTVQHVYGAGSFLSGLKNFGTKLYDGFKKYVPIARKVASVIPFTAPYADYGKSTLGFGRRKVTRRRRRGGNNMQEGYEDCETDERNDTEYEYEDDIPLSSSGSIMSRSELKQRLKDF